MNKMELKEKLMDTLFDESRAERIAEIIEVTTDEELDELYWELTDDKDEDYYLAIKDDSIVAVVDYLEELSVEDIESRFNGCYTYNYLIASESGAGMLFIEA